MRVIPCVSEELSASQEGLCSMQQVLCMAGLTVCVFLNAQYIETCNMSICFPFLLYSVTLL